MDGISSSMDSFFACPLMRVSGCVYLGSGWSACCTHIRVIAEKEAKPANLVARAQDEHAAMVAPSKYTKPSRVSFRSMQTAKASSRVVKIRSIAGSFHGLRRCSFNRQNDNYSSPETKIRYSRLA
jgi:hypothetical protein